MVSVHDGLGHFPLHWETEGPEEGLELDDEDLFAYSTDGYMAARIEYIFEMLLNTIVTLFTPETMMSQPS